MRIGVFGGTFNPPHQGHKRLALEFMGRLSLDLMLIIPTYTPPHKESVGLVNGEDRLNMCRLCFSEKGFEVSDIELKRKGKSYTVNTLQELKEIYPNDELFFIMGSDMLLSFHTWREPDTILSLATVCAATREKGLTVELENYVNERYFDKRDRFKILDFTPIEISSTEIRDEISNDNEAQMLSFDVESYIKERGLYLESMD